MALIIKEEVQELPEDTMQCGSEPFTDIKKEEFYSDEIDVEESKDVLESIRTLETDQNQITFDLSKCNSTNKDTDSKNELHKVGRKRSHNKDEVPRPKCQQALNSSLDVKKNSKSFKLHFKESCKTLKISKANFHEYRELKQIHGSSSNSERSATSLSKSYLPTEDFLCHICFKTFNTPFLLKKHVSLHNKTTFQCELCKKDFFSKNGLKLHMYSHFPEEYLTCKSCKTTCRNVRLFRKHMSGCSESKKEKKLSKSKSLLKCALCEKNFSSKQGLKGHILSHFPKEYCTCKGCKKMCKTYSLFQQHVRACDKVKKEKTLGVKKSVLKCDLCKRSFSTKSGLKGHIFSHFPKDYLTCKGCQKTFKTFTAYSKHCGECSSLKKNKTNSNKKISLKCDLCVKSFFTKNGLRTHIYSHFPKEYLTCRGCQKVFENGYFYKQHVGDCSKFKKKKMAEKNKNEFECDLCKKNFRNKAGVKHHMVSHFPEAYLTCEVCKKTFKSVASYLKHSRKCNKSMKKFQCHICKKIVWGFSDSSLRGHMRVHSKKKNVGSDNPRVVVKKSNSSRKKSKAELKKLDLNAQALGCVSTEIVQDTSDNKDAVHRLISEIEIKEEFF